MPDRNVDVKSLVKVANSTKVDDILQKSKFATLFTTEQIKEWETSVLENTAARSEQRKKNDTLKEMKQELEKTVKKESIQHYFGKEYIPSGVNLHSSIRLTDPTNLELGALIAALIDFANDGAIGSSRNVGLGVIDFSVIDLENDMEIISKNSYENYIFKSIVNTNLELSSSIKEAYNDYMQWLQSVSKENIEAISNIA
jgi:CRISPR type IV-associated protein Csf2